MIDVRPPYPQDTRPEVCCVAWHARDAALKLVHAYQHRAAPPVTSLTHVLRTPSLHLTHVTPHAFVAHCTRCCARRHLASCCPARRLDRPALDTRSARKSYSSGGRSSRLGRSSGALTVSPVSPLTGVGGRPQPCLAARASSRSHARARAPAPPPEPALAVHRLRQSGGGANEHVPPVVSLTLSVTRPRSPDVAARADDPPSLGVRVLCGFLFESLCTSTTTNPTVRLPPRPGGKKPVPF